MSYFCFWNCLCNDFPKDAKPDFYDSAVGYHRGQYNIILTHFASVRAKATENIELHYVRNSSVIILSCV